jgi:hypothetical protein
MKYRVRFQIATKLYEVGQDQWGYISTCPRNGVVFDSSDLMKGISAAYMFADENTTIQLAPSD